MIRRLRPLLLLLASLGLAAVTVTPAADASVDPPPGFGQVEPGSEQTDAVTANDLCQVLNPNRDAYVVSKTDQWLAIYSPPDPIVNGYKHTHFYWRCRIVAFRVGQIPYPFGTVLCLVGNWHHTPPPVGPIRTSGWGPPPTNCPTGLS